ncbi:putative transcriptional regulator [Arthrobacter globiformis NBRC 12137]|uniref:Putative transcriptional regulator n=1 Tax=Arthrobacter globiformis (strain ATCC 8010 / DSM 20124 / JCM 1332 / NBRC 12137 / NCIMB 8907 / NRRL B-2979 / 168) TaxID=1077972 RepID=H0QL63_ARTG1|nr:ROK family protein [Arthrobacter globiformis]GAB13564.1 putative transcriptional regulator [Arthrobacter globiformis NBRC 12137]
MDNGGPGELLHILRDGRPRTRADLAGMTGLGRGAISSRLEPLLRLGLVAPVSGAPSTGGRPSARLAFNPGAGLAAAADVGATHATMALTDLSGRVLTESTERLEISSGPEPVLDWLTMTLTGQLKAMKRPAADILAVGVGLPGPVEHSTGKPISPPIMPGWDGFDVPAHIQQTFDVPVLVDNDVNLMALGERATRRPNEDNMIFLKVATGIGSGVVSGGILQRGAAGVAGDVGHIAVSRGAGILCRCGKTACLEAIAGAPAIAAQLRGNGLEAITGNDVVTLVRSGDLAAIQAVRQAGRDIGEMLNMCVSLINPSLIVVGGSLAQSGEHLIAGIRETVYARSTPLATQHLNITQSETGPEAGVVGASILAVEYALAPHRVNDLATSLLAAGREDSHSPQKVEQVAQTSHQLRDTVAGQLQDAFP